MIDIERIGDVRLMGDEETRALILAERDPKEQKRLGRRVCPWDGLFGLFMSGIPKLVER